MTAAPPSSTIRFADFELDVRALELRKHGMKLKLAGQPIEVLAMLLERPGEVVTREELRARLWSGDTFVDFDHSLNAVVNKLRDALGDSADEPRFIETLPRRGYRFIAPLEGASAGAATPTRAQPAALRRRLWTLAVFGAVLLVAALAGNVGGVRDRLFGTSEPDVRSVAVLPFQNISQNPDEEYFADGMTEALISNLSQVSALRVTSRTSVMQYRVARKPLPEIARELNVDAVVEGAVVRSGGRVRISAQLVHAPTDRNLWAANYERDLRDILALQNEIARAITAEIRVAITPQEMAHFASASAVDPEVYRLYLLGRFYQNKRMGWATARAQEYFEQAIRLDPDYALAHVALAETGIFGTPPKEAMARSKEAALRGLELAPGLADAHKALGMVQMFQDWDWAGAERSFRRAIELNPGSADAHYRFAWMLAVLGRFDEALAECRRALEIDPLSVDTNVFLGRIHLFARDPDRALAQFQRTLELDPNAF